MEIRDLGGAGTSKAAARAARRALSEDPGGDAMRHTRFLGRAEVPLAATLAASNGMRPESTTMVWSYDQTDSFGPWGRITVIL